MSSIKRSGAKTSLDKLDGIEKVATMGSFKSLAFHATQDPSYENALFIAKVAERVFRGAACAHVAGLFLLISSNLCWQGQPSTAKRTYFG